MKKYNISFYFILASVFLITHILIPTHHASHASKYKKIDDIKYYISTNNSSCPISGGHDTHNCLICKTLTPFANLIVSLIYTISIFLLLVLLSNIKINSKIFFSKNYFYIYSRAPPII